MLSLKFLGWRNDTYIHHEKYDTKYKKYEKYEYNEEFKAIWMRNIT